MTFAQTERAELCRLLLELGPDAPTLCDGWDTHDLAAHLWIRENDPLGAPGIVAKPLQPVTDRRMLETRRKWSYDELVERLAKGPVALSVFAIPGVDELANTIEYFVHLEDVRRAGEAPLPPRPLDPQVQELFWRRLKLMGRALFRRSPVGVVLETADVAGAEPIVANKGGDVVTLTGLPSELLLFAYGRTGAADVRADGTEEAVTALVRADLAI